MPDSTQPSPPSSSSPPSLPWWQSLVASLPGTITATSAIWVIGKPLGQALPGLIQLGATTGKWVPALMCMLAQGMLVAPVPTVALARSLLGRVLGKKE